MPSAPQRVDDVEQDQATWRVDDVRAEVVELRSRGVEILDYDLPGIKTEDGVADVGDAFAAWFVDPGKNSLSILRTRDRWPAGDGWLPR